jgi:pimeloyl-ACP methyl ester carboxylesterase
MSTTRRSPTRPARASPRDWAFRADDGAVLEALAAGRHVESLREHFGSAVHPQLAALAATAQHRHGRGGYGPQVLIVPGMMGSRLEVLGAGRRRMVWIDPERIGAGALAELRLPSAAIVRPTGVLLFSYARLLLNLRAAGFDAQFFPYDWRRGIDELGGILAAHIRAQSQPVSLIAHSMGGLVARVALKQLAKRRVRKLIMLGTPNGGSLAPVQALRGTYPFVRKLARLVRGRTPEQLAEHIFRTFPGLYHMLPPPHRRLSIDLTDPKCWPGDGPAPDRTLLGTVLAARAQLAAPDERMTHIVGINRPTVIAVRRSGRGFEYASSRNGDGTVAVMMARLPRLKCYFVDELHGNLANNSRVIRAVVDLLKRGRTTELAQRFVPARGRLTRLGDAELRSGDAAKIDWRSLTSAQREAVLADLDAEPAVL